MKISTVVAPILQVQVEYFYENTLLVPHVLDNNVRVLPVTFIVPTITSTVCTYCFRTVDQYGSVPVPYKQRARKV